MPPLLKVEAKGPGDAPLAGMALASGLLFLAMFWAFGLNWNFECAFRTFTTNPCPSCGVTRLGLKLMEGSIGAAFLMNPFAFVSLGLFGVFAFGDTLAQFRGKKWVISSKILARPVLIVTTFGFLLNWYYLIRTGV